MKDNNRTPDVQTTSSFETRKEIPQKEKRSLPGDPVSNTLHLFQLEDDMKDEAIPKDLK